MYTIENEIIKSKIKSKIRTFFDNRGFTEVDTPTLSETAIPEHTIELFSTELKGEFTKTKKLYLLPSPELYMKKLLCRFNRDIYQISHVFRNAEQTSHIHKNEFTMLEFYKTNTDYNDTIKLTDSLLKYIFPEIETPSIICTVDDLLKKYTSFSLCDIHDRNIQKKIEYNFNIQLPENEDFDDTFNRIFIHIIESELKKFFCPVFIKDYPCEIECLAEKDGIIRHRFEMYLNGIEMANGYSEMTDSAQIRELFENENKKMTERDQLYDKELPLMRMEKSSGVAIGLDRLIMAVFKINDIKDLYCDGDS